MEPRYIEGAVIPHESLSTWYQDRTVRMTSSPTNEINNNDASSSTPVKRRKIVKQQSSPPVTIGQLVFPVQFPPPSFMIIDTINQESLYASWSHSIQQPDLEIACLKVFTATTHQLVMEHEIVRALGSNETLDFMMNDDNNKNDNIMDRMNKLTLFANLARLSVNKTVTTRNVILAQQEQTIMNGVITLNLAANIDQTHTRNALFSKVFPYLYYPSSHNHDTSSATISIDDFYRYLQPPVSKQLLTKCHTQGLRPTLTPFQSQNVEWMVKKEGFTILDNGSLHEIPIDNDQLPFFWEKINTTANGQHLYINRVTNEISHHIPVHRHTLYHGGILADEMGLGKTVSAIAMILLNTPEKSDIFNHTNSGELRKTGATLIITPATISHQWESEFKKHAPTLKVAFYHGIKNIPQHTETEQVADYLASNDVVLTTYNVLRTEIHYSRQIQDRPRRCDIKHKVRKSPLVQLLWWRCIVDEAQKVESPVTLVAEMACLIPRYYSWGITGTPINSTNYYDLYGLCKFVDYFDGTPRQFRNMYSTPALHSTFLDFMKKIMRRNLKSFLYDQIHIPKQHRQVITISFSTIEQHYYNDLQLTCRQEANPSWLDSIGWEKPTDTSDIAYTRYIDSMQALRKWLNTLRETCVHPAVVGRDQENVRTLDQVLKIMIQKTKDKVEEAQAQLANDKLTYGGMHELTQQGNWTKPLSIYLDWMPQVEKMVMEYNTRIDQAKGGNQQDMATDPIIPGMDEHKMTDSNQDTEEKSKLVMSLQLKQVMWQNILHRFYFYTAGIYHMLEDKDKENEYYEKAASVRRQILSKPQEKVQALALDIKSTEPLLSLGKVGFSRQRETIFLSTDFLTRVNDLADILNKQLLLIEEWRTLLRKYLTSNLVDSNEDEIKGDEYDNSLIIQEKCDIYQDLYQDILRDRHFWINGVWLTQRVSNIQDENNENGIEHEEIKDLRENLDKLRQKVAPKVIGSDNMRSLLTELREIASGPNVTHKVESYVIQAEMTRLAGELKQQKDFQDKLEMESRKLSALANHRIEYYRALQNISDHVETWESKNPSAKIQSLEFQMGKLENTIADQSSRQRYLENIAMEKQNEKNSAESDKELLCLICKENFTKGIVTYCGHMYCSVCAHEWFRTSSRCPQCSSTVRHSEWYPISWKTAVLHQGNVADNDKRAHPTDDVGGISVDTLEDIRKVSIEEGLGAKLDSVIRHIKYLQQTTNGKCLVFSQWNRILGLLSEGLKRNNIGFVNIASGPKDDDIVRFKEDETINVMLLHARSQSSGLTLLEAKTIFIIEPVLNESLEKQAISRVHRIGQTDETSVFWYIVRDTIEERIQMIHDATQRHRQIDNLILDTVYKPVMASRSEGGGEYVSDQDLKKCFTELDIPM
ncbi:SNF2 family N-terminal domain-containing protein [Halteromyces radiatus]|uniref:SNF2 family N-terminal domain-containing protein n=1 Tax=Halteromyces radiatus TaxID=101107 RepID=UPI002220AA84|nr:SNF2 family N-terminal domain-containing protein [Halteromyces radiatus]KAI8089837.1 SNF2 family N-terminal domain-containing protein [Halteromyces radiatus]